MNDITIEDLKEAINKADMMLRPYCLFCNPEDKEKLLSEFPDLEKTYQIVSEQWMEKGKIIGIERKKLEEWTFGGLFNERTESKI